MKKNFRYLLFGGFAVYCIALFYFSFLHSRVNVSDMSLLEYIKHSVNLIPLKNITEYFSNIGSGMMNTNTIVFNLIGNFLLFLPMGFFIPAIFKKINSLLKCILIVFGLIFIVEGIQLVFQIGIFDIDDFILNIVGAMLGFGIFKIKPVEKLCRPQI